MIRQQVKGVACHHPMPMSHSQEDPRQFAVEGRVLHLPLGQLLAEELYGNPLAVLVELFQAPTNACVGGVTADPGWRIVNWEGELVDVVDGLPGGVERKLAGGRPLPGDLRAGEVGQRSNQGR